MYGKICPTVGNTPNLHSHLKIIHIDCLAIKNNSKPVVVSKGDLIIIYFDNL